MIISSSPPTTRPPSGLEPSETAPSERSPNPIATLPSHGRSPDFVPKKTFSDSPQSPGAGAIRSFGKPSDMWKGNDNTRINLGPLRGRGSESDKPRWPARPANKHPHSQPS